MKVMREARAALNPKAPDDWERNYLGYTYPNTLADMDRVWVTDYTTGDAPQEDYLPQYNCIAWSLGLTNQFIWPWSGEPVTRAQFDEFYHQHGYEPSDEGEIAVYQQPHFDPPLTGPYMTHAALHITNDFGPSWESKLGAYMRVQHPRMEDLYGAAPSYGQVVGYYAKSLGAPDLNRYLQDKTRNPAPTPDEQRMLEERANRVERPTRDQFARLYEEWRQTWFEPATAASSDPYARRNSQQFNDLVALGPEAMPLFMQRLSHPGEYFALQAVAELAGPDSVVHYPPNDPMALTGEQGRALATMRRWLQR